MNKNERYSAKQLSQAHYFTGKPCKDGHIAKRRTVNGNCTVCEQKKNNNRYLSYIVSYVEKNKKTIRETATRWQKNNKGKVNSETAKRHAAKMLRMPKWLSTEQKQDIKDLYTMASELEKVFPWKQHVDHVVPLQGKTVSGLHVPWNLQIIPAVWNIAKGNRHID